MKKPSNDSFFWLEKPEAIGFMEMDTELWPLWKQAVEGNPGEADRLVHVGNTIFRNFCREEDRAFSLCKKKWKVAAIIARLLKASSVDIARDSGKGETFYQGGFFHPDRYNPAGGISYEIFPFTEGKGIRREVSFLTGRYTRETLLNYD
jgi:hypothetical protein